MRTAVTINQIDACLPQTQCTQCSYPRCRAYAEALANGTAGINQCPPGGDITIQALSSLLRIPPIPLDPGFGSHKPRARAVIDEILCIGCRKCIDACPVDAILGTRKLMHTVISQECTGCELCLPPCPVDCIAMMPDLTEHARSASGSDHTNSPLPQSGRGVGEREPFSPSSPSLLPPGEKGASRGVLAHAPLYSGNEGEGARADELWPEYTQAETTRWRERTEKRLQRLARNKHARRVKSAVISSPITDRDQIRAEIRAAVERVKARKRRSTGQGPSS